MLLINILSAKLFIVLFYVKFLVETNNVSVKYLKINCGLIWKKSSLKIKIYGV